MHTATLVEIIMCERLHPEQGFRASIGIVHPVGQELLVGDDIGSRASVLEISTPFIFHYLIQARTTLKPTPWGSSRPGSRRLRPQRILPCYSSRGEHNRCFTVPTLTAQDACSTAWPTCSPSCACSSASPILGTTPTAAGLPPDREANRTPGAPTTAAPAAGWRWLPSRR